MNAISTTNAADNTSSYGYILYFHADPATMRNNLIRLIQHSSELFSGRFTRIRDNNQDRFSDLQESAIELLSQRIRNSTFANSEMLVLTNASSSYCQTQKIEFMARTIQNWFPQQTPNYLYFETTQQLDLQARWNFFQNAFIEHSFDLAYAHPVIAINDELYPASYRRTIAGFSCKMANFQEYSSCWLHPDYLPCIQERIASPTEFLGGKWLNNALDPKVVIQASRVHSIHSEYGEDYLLFRASTAKHLSALAAILTRYLIPLSPPNKCWTEDNWRQWRDTH